MGPEWAALTCTCKRTANSNFDRHYASCPMAAHNPASTVDLGPVADEIARLRARIEALEEALRKTLIDPFLPRSLKAEIRALLSTTEPEGRG